jgi:transcriptional accessory protein Tex/SPT6
MMDSLHQNKNQSFIKYSQEVKIKIRKVLKFFRCQNFDVPYITKYKFNEIDPELTQADIWRVFNLDVEYGKFLVQKK